MKFFSIIALCLLTLCGTGYAQEVLSSPSMSSASAASSSGKTGSSGRSFDVNIQQYDGPGKNFEFTVHCGTVLRNKDYGLLGHLPIFDIPVMQDPVNGLDNVSTQASTYKGFAIPVILGGALLGGAYLLKERNMLDSKWEQAAVPLAGLGCMFVGDWWGTFNKVGALKFAKQSRDINNYKTELSRHTDVVREHRAAHRELIEDRIAPTHQVIKRLAFVLLEAHRARKELTEDDSFEQVYGFRPENVMDVDEDQQLCRELLGNTWADYLQEFPEVQGKVCHRLSSYTNSTEYIDRRKGDKKCGNQGDVEETHKKNLEQMKKMQLQVTNAMYAQLSLKVLMACRTKIQQEFNDEYCGPTSPVAPIQAKKDLAFTEGRLWGARLSFWTGLVTTIASFWGWFSK